MKNFAIFLGLIALLLPVAMAWIWALSGMTFPVFLAGILTTVVLAIVAALVYGTSVISS